MSCSTREDLNSNQNQPTYTSHNGKLSIGAVIAAGLILIGCSGGNTDPAEGGNEPVNVLTPKGWELTWSDEFDGSSLDASKWNIQTGDGTEYGIPGVG